MPTVTVPRPDLTTEEVVQALKDGLGDGYNVLPGKAAGRTMYQAEHNGQPNEIVVGTGENRLVKAQVTITPRGGQTELRISAGGLTWDWLITTSAWSRRSSGYWRARRPCQCASRPSAAGRSPS